MFLDLYSHVVKVCLLNQAENESNSKGIKQQPIQKSRLCSDSNSGNQINKCERVIK